MTQEEVNSFSFDGIHGRLESKALIFHHTLRRLTECQIAPLSIKSLDPAHDIESRTAIVGTLASMIMHCQSQQHNYFQRIMGIFFHASSCSKDVINTLAKAHICVSYDSTLTAVGSLVEDAISIVREAVLNNNWYIIYDNINLYMAVTDQRVDNADTQINGTIATIVPGENLGIAGRPYPFGCHKNFCKFASFFFAYYFHVPPYVNNQKRDGFFVGRRESNTGSRAFGFFLFYSSDPLGSCVWVG